MLQYAVCTDATWASNLSEILASPRVGLADSSTTATTGIELTKYGVNVSSAAENLVYDSDKVQAVENNLVKKSFSITYNLSISHKKQSISLKGNAENSTINESTILKIVIVPPTWVLDSLSNYELQNTSNYANLLEKNSIY